METALIDGNGRLCVPGEADSAGESCRCIVAAVVRVTKNVGIREKGTLRSWRCLFGGGRQRTGSARYREREKRRSVVDGRLLLRRRDATLPPH